MGVEAHPLGGLVEAALRDQRIERDLGRRTDAPFLELGIFLDQVGAEEAHRGEVLAHLRLDDRRIEAEPGIIIDQERAVGAKLGAEEAGRGVGQDLIFAACDVEPEDVRDPGVIAVAEQRLAVGGEGEILRGRRGQRQGRDRAFGIARLEVGAVPHLERLLGVDRRVGGGDLLAVGRHVEVEQYLAVAEGLDLVEAGVGRGDPDQSDEAVLVADSPQALVGMVEGEVADARVGQQLALAPGIDVDRHELAERIILVGVESGPAGRVEGDAGDLVEHHPVEVGEVRRPCRWPGPCARGSRSCRGSGRRRPGCSSAHRQSRATSSPGPWG